MQTLNKFHGYLGRLVVLRGTQSRTAKIVGGDGLELYMQGIDGKFLNATMIILNIFGNDEF
ncbi:MAG: hypothetical protein CM15mV3_1320 [Caudoviricetes sp.]|nr:MAG: hypothetical protein CM15mV3_1320 [Caudoviricetes sp.]